MAVNGQPTVIVNEKCGPAWVDKGSYVDAGLLSLADEHMTLSNNISGVGQHILNAVHAESQLNGNAIGATRHDISKGIGDASRDILGAICDTNMNTHNAVNDGVVSVKESIERNGIADRQDINRIGELNLQSVERNGGDTRLSIERTSAETRGLLNKANTEILLSSKDILMEVVRSKCELERQAADNKACIIQKFTEEQLYSDRRMAEYVSMLKLQASENKCSIELEAFKNKESLARQLAECCCELKEKIGARADQTDALIDSNEKDRLREALAKCQSDGLVQQILNGLGLGGVRGAATHV